MPGSVAVGFFGAVEIAVLRQQWERYVNSHLAFYSRVGVQLVGVVLMCVFRSAEVVIICTITSTAGSGNALIHALLYKTRKFKHFFFFLTLLRAAPPYETEIEDHGTFGAGSIIIAALLWQSAQKPKNTLSMNND